MESSSHNNFRERMAQFFGWVRSFMSQQQFIQSDRQLLDGMTRSGDDPDNRARTEHLAARLDAMRQQHQQHQQRGGWGHGR
jgi:hypothetical protein